MNIPSILRHWFTLGATAATAWLIAALTLSADDQAELTAAMADLVGPLVIIGTLIVTALWRVALVWMAKIFRTGSGETGEKSSGGPGGLPLAIIGAAGVLCGLLPSCAGYPLTGSLMLRDPETGAKGGLVFQGSGKPRATLRMPIYDDNGALLGMADLQAGREVTATK